MPDVAVTVFMPVFNGAAYLRESIDSILRQTFHDFELLAIDDGSSDASPDILSPLTTQDRRIRVLRHDRNHGLTDTRNEGLQEARGHFIAFLDCDDLAHPKRLERQLAFFRAHPALGMAGTWTKFIDRNGKRTGLAWKSRIADAELPPALLFGNCFATSSVMAKTAILRRTGFRSHYPVCEDYDLWVRLAQSVPVVIVRSVLTSYRMTGDNTSARNEGLMETMVRNIAADQLNELGIPVDTQSIDLHRRISRAIGPFSMEALQEAGAWLEGLYAANASRHRYDRLSLARQLMHRWALLCGNSGQGRNALRLFRHSSLSRIAPVPPWELTKLAVKILTGEFHD